MNRQDLSGARTAQDLERKYNFEEIKRNVEKVKKNSEDINSINKDLQDFAKNITKDLGELQDQVDGNITTWFYKGVPTLSNYPANEWTTTEDRNNHLGDLYYDQDTGYSYRFTMLKSVFQWVKLTDSDVTKALAVANAAQDTADKKRRVFLEQPKPPYDSGDMWIKDKEIWICQVSRAEGTYQTGDFINNLKYTDDTYAKGVNDDLIIVKGTVTKTRQDVDSLQTTMTSTVEALNTQGEKIGTLETKQSNITQTVEGIDARVTHNTNSINNINTPIKDLSGSTIHLEDGANAPLVKLEVDGKTEQATREGYNLLDISKISSIDNVYGSLNVKDNKIIIHTNNITNIKTNQKLSQISNLKVGETYYLNGNSTGSKQIYLKNSNYFWAFGTSKQITQEDLDGIIGFYANGKNSDAIISNLIISKQNKPYEPYGVMPSPDYPSEIQNVGYENLFDGIYEKGSININTGNLVESDRVRTKNFIPINPKTSYTISNSYDGETWGIYYDKNKKYLGFVKLVDFSTSGKITTIENAYYLKWYQISQDLTIKTMLSKGTTPHSYITYGKYGLDITNVGENLLPFKDGINFTVKGLHFYTENGNLFIDGTTAGELSAKSQVYKDNFSFTLPAGTYYFDRLNLPYATYIIKYDDNVILVTNKGRFTLNELTKVYFGIYSHQDTFNNFKYETILVKGTTPTPYEPYQAYNTQIILPTQLKSINNIQDKLAKRDGTWGVLETSKNIILNGNESNIKKAGGKEFIIRYPDITKEASNLVENVRSNYYKWVKWAGSWNTVGTITITPPSNLDIRIYEDRFSDINQFKQWLKSKYDSGNPVKIQYKLETPIFTPLDQVEQDKLNKIGTFKGVNNISTTDELEPNMNITYVRDTNISNYVSEQLGELSVSNNQIKASVKEIGTNLDTNTQQLNQVQNTITSQNQTIEIISKNIDRTNGNIKEVTTTNGFTFNNKGLNIYTDENSYNTQIDNVGTYYRDGNAVIAQTTKDGSLMKDLSEQGQHRYSYDTTDSTYNLIDETIEIDGEIGYATFWNGED